MSTDGHQIFPCEPLTPEAYQPFGEVLAVHESAQGEAANQGTSLRYNHLCKMQNLLPDTAQLNVCIFRATPATDRPVPLRVLEKHPHSTQTFAPLVGAGQFLVVVARAVEGEIDAPDLGTLRAFLVEGATGISYFPGVWHHPLIALEAKQHTADFLCHVFEEPAEKFPGNENTVIYEDSLNEIPAYSVDVAV